MILLSKGLFEFSYTYMAVLLVCVWIFGFPFGTPKPRFEQKLGDMQTENRSWY